MDTKTRTVLQWVHAPTERAATEAVVRLASHGSDGWGYVPADRTGDWGAEWEPEPGPWEREPEGWDDMPEPEGVADD